MKTTAAQLLAMTPERRSLYGMYSFRNLGTAFHCADHAPKMRMVVMGENETFWVVTPAVGEQLVKMGYEYAHQ